MRRVCAQCGAVLNQYNPGKLCFPCQEKHLGQNISDDEDNIDAEEFARILGLKNAESVRRKGRKGELPPRIPGRRKWLWYRSVVEDWIKEEGIGNKQFRMGAHGIASNLITCREDSIIYLNLSDKIGSKVFGQEYVLGTTDAGRVEPITLTKLVKIDKTVALKMLGRLSKEIFPELTGISNWADLTYDKITKDLTERLKNYF